ncbi:MAG: L-2-amino-thiazoline-4-carboxylic acid hydrolase [Anaerolineales bacterium]|nr:L-2-amino-thiazoline-4-carboxylic acid hydrolase [Anaerolineales bacterium]
MSEMITTGACAFEVGLMARRTALLHYYFSKAIIDKLGEEEGKELIKEAIGAYGRHCGQSVRDGVLEMGLPITDENYNKVRDLPAFGWKMETIKLDNSEDRLIATYCPLAAAFQDLGPEGEKIGRLYCYVDQAKYEAYDPDKVFIHARNVLDGDPYCEFLIEPVEKGA